jgi:[protein-PII] uridylyltransferase
MSLRVHLHALRGRADERLTFELQPALAERLGYADRNGMSAAERMMKHYFVNALEIGRVTRIFLARLEEENAKLSDRAPRALPKMLAKDETGRAINLRLHTNRIDFAKAAQARKNPVDLFRLFRASSKRPDIGFHPDALALVTECLPQVTKAVRRDEEITKLFLATLNEPKDPARVLRVMSETGLLGKFLPSFGQITGRIEYGLYRRFPLDEHIFRSIGMLAQLRTGALQEMHPIATGIVKRTKDATALSLTVLLHETRPSADPDDEALSEALVGRVVRRLGVDDELASRIAWVAARPYLLMRIAERRNLGQTRAIARFAEQVGDIESLELLLVLTVCRLRVISDTAWDAWTRTQVSALYFGARASIEGGEAGLIDWFRERGKATAQELARKLPGWSVKELEAFLETVSGELASALPTESLARVAELVAGARAGKLTSAVSAVVSEDVVEAIVYTRDRPGLLSNLAGAISESAGAVRSVHAMTGADGYVIDVFTIQFAEGVDGQSLTELARRVHPALLGVAKTPPKKPPVLSKRLGDRRAIFEVEPTVRLDLEASDDCLVVEAEGRDRPGLLYRLSSALAEIGVQIKSAHIATYGERAVDAFYLQDSPGYKITDKRRLQSIERRLLAVLAGD